MLAVENRKLIISALGTFSDMGCNNFTHHEGRGK